MGENFESDVLTLEYFLTKLPNHSIFWGGLFLFAVNDALNLMGHVLPQMKE